MDAALKSPPDPESPNLVSWAAASDTGNAVGITVGGRPATLMNVSASADGTLDGSLGCPERNADKADGCYGPQPDLQLRLAVVPVGEHTLLAWARVQKDKPDPSFVARFERMLGTVRFR